MSAKALTYESHTIELETTIATDRDEMFTEDCCRDCGAEEVLAVEINAARGKRKIIHVCDDCAEPMKDAPKGVYDPTVLAYHPESEYDGIL